MKINHAPIICDSVKENIEFVSVFHELKESDHSYSSYIVTLLFFNHPKWILVGGNGRKEIMIWWLEENDQWKLKARYEAHNDDVNHLVAMNKELGIFLSCSYDKKIVAHKILECPPFYEHLKIVCTCDGIVGRLLVLTDDLFLAACEDTSLRIISYSKSQTIHHIVDDGDWWSRPVLSQFFKSAFYINLFPSEGSSNEYENVKLMSYETGETLKLFSSHKKVVYSLGTYLNREHEEILIMGSEGGLYFFFTTNRVENVLLHKIEPTTHTNDMRSRLCMISPHQSKIGRYFVGGNSQGVFGLYSIDRLNVQNCQRLGSVKVHNQEVYDVCIISKTQTSVTIATCSYEGQIKFTEIRNLDLVGFYEEQASKDMLERTDFLMSERESVYFEELDHCVFEIRLENVCLVNPRIFLY